MWFSVNILQPSVNIAQTHLSRSRLCLHMAWFHSPRASASTVLINLGHISSNVIFCEHFTAISRHYSNTLIKVKTVSAYSLVPFSPRASAGTVLINLGHISSNEIFCEHFTAISRHYSKTPIKVKTVSAYSLVVLLVITSSFDMNVINSNSIKLERRGRVSYLVWYDNLNIMIVIT